MHLRNLLAPVVALLVSCFVSAVLSQYRGSLAVLDIPNERSLHARATPRSGGLGILAGLAAGIATAAGLPPIELWALVALALIAMVSFTDDLYGLSPVYRLSAHVLAAMFMIFAANYSPVNIQFLGFVWHAPIWILEGFSLLFVVWMVNLYNFMDGMDGFAAGMACMGFATLALLGVLAGAPRYAFAALVVCAAAAGFLPFNFPPARLFMGDVGSSSLGFMAAIFILWADRTGLFPLWLGALPFSPFIIDATWTLLRRLAQGKKPWQAHREHLYQRLVRLGWGHKRTTLWGYVLMVECSSIAVAGFCVAAVWVRGVLLGLLAATYLALFAGVNALERRRLSH